MTVLTWIAYTPLHVSESIFVKAELRRNELQCWMQILYWIPGYWGVWKFCGIFENPCLVVPRKELLHKLVTSCRFTLNIILLCVIIYYYYFGYYITIDFQYRQTLFLAVIIASILAIVTPLLFIRLFTIGDAIDKNHKLTNNRQIRDMLKNNFIDESMASIFLECSEYL